MSRILAIIVMSALLIAGGCTDVNKVVEKTLAGELQKKVGKADSYDVQLNAKPQYKLLRGEVDLLVVTGKNVQLGGDLLVDSVRIDINDIKYDIKRRKLNTVGKAYVNMGVSERSLTAFARRERKELTGLDINIENGSISVATTRGGQRQSMTGTLAVQNGNSLNFVPSKEHGSASLNDRSLESINPVLNLSRFAFPLTITGIDLDKGYMRISASARPPASLFK